MLIKSVGTKSFPKWLYLVEYYGVDVVKAMRVAKTEYVVTMQFFPDVNDMDSAKNNMFEGTSFKLDFLTKPSGLEDFGFGKKVRMADRVQSSDKIFLVAYPYFNVNGTFIPSSSATSMLSVST